MHTNSSGDVKKEQYIQNWLRGGSINRTRSNEVCYQVSNMAKPTETSSTKSSKLLSMAALLKKKVKSSTKAVAQPFKKLKQAISTSALTHSTHSCLSRAFYLFNNEANDSNTESAADHGSVHSNDSRPEEITLEEVLHMYLHFYLASNADHFLTLEALK